MTEAYVLTLGQNAIMVALTLAGPILLISLVAGSLVSLVQAATQINQFNVDLYPKVDRCYSGIALDGLLDATTGNDLCL